MTLHEDKDYFEDILDRLSERSGYRMDVLEKDYYVVLMLKELSEKQNAGLPAYFKGGTALYKRLKNAQRFSEDIDLSVDTRGCSGSQNKKRLNLATKGYSSMVRDESAGRTNKSEVITYYTYDPIADYDANDRLDRFGRMMIEATSFTISEPMDEMEITPLLYDLSSESERKELQELYGIVPFMVKTIAVDRIFIDKLFAAEAYARKSTEENRAFDAAKHIYDLSVMHNMPEIQALLLDEKRMKRLLDIRMEEEMGRLDGIPGVRPIDFTFFKNASCDKTIEREYSDMMSVYVFRSVDRIPYAKAMESLGAIHEKLLENAAWRDYKPSVLTKLESKKKEAAEINASLDKTKDRRREDVIE